MNAICFVLLGDFAVRAMHACFRVGAAALFDTSCALYPQGASNSAWLLCRACMYFMTFVRLRNGRTWCGLVKIYVFITTKF